MRWIIGVDLRSGDGPIRFARWLQQTSGAADGEQLTFVHVLEQEHLRFVLRKHHIDEVTAGATREVQRLLGSEGAHGDVRVVQGIAAEETLEQIRSEIGADAVVLGRAAPREGFSVVRLGRVARRMLRTLASPILVVPPDLRLNQIGSGPIGMLTGLSDDALGASRFAADLAVRLARPLVALHALRTAPTPYIEVDATRRDQDALATEAGTALDAWLARHGIRPQGREILLDSPVDGAEGWAKRVRSPLLVAGSRRLSDAERLVQSSTGSTLAATAPLATAVVPR